MKSGEKLLEIELGKKKSKKYKRLYNGIFNRITEKLKSSNSELELIEKFISASNEFNSNKPKNKNNEFFHTSLRKQAFNNYNLFFLMKDCLENYNINVNIFTIKGVYYIKTDNYLIFDKKITEHDNFHRSEKDDFFVFNENLIYVNTFRRLSNIYKLINKEKSEKYNEIIDDIVNNYYDINTILNVNYDLLTIDIINKISNGYKNYEIDFLKGLTYMKEKKYEFAEFEFKKVLNYDRKYNDLLFKIGLSLSKQKKYEEALKYYEEIQDKDYVVFLNMGSSNYNLKKYNEATKYFYSAISSNEKCKEAYINISLSLLKELDYYNAKKIIENAIKNFGKTKTFENILNKIEKEEKNSKFSVVIIDEEKNIYRVMKEVKA